MERPSRLSMRTLVLAAAVLSCARPAGAQITTGSVAGTVRDAQGAVIPGATVTLVHEGQETRSAPVVTSAAGDFVIANVSSGAYAVDTGPASASSGIPAVDAVTTTISNSTRLRSRGRWSAASASSREATT